MKRSDEMKARFRRAVADLKREIWFGKGGQFFIESLLVFLPNPREFLDFPYMYIFQVLNVHDLKPINHQGNMIFF
jgi:hypothetical protein